MYELDMQSAVPVLTLLHFLARIWSLKHTVHCTLKSTNRLSIMWSIFWGQVSDVGTVCALPLSSGCTAAPPALVHLTGETITFELLLWIHCCCCCCFLNVLVWVTATFFCQVPVRGNRCYDMVLSLFHEYSVETLLPRIPTGQGRDSFMRWYF